MTVDTQQNRQRILQAVGAAQSSVRVDNNESKPAAGHLHQLSPDALWEHFSRVLGAHHSHVTAIDSLASLPQAIAEYLEQYAAGPIVYGGDNPLLNNLAWADAGLQWRRDTLTDDGQVAVTSADCAIADTGTVVLLSGRANPTRNNFLAEHHIVVLDKNNIFPYSEDAWNYLLLEHEKAHKKLPRAINFISGPSSSADVGLKLEYGAHGPRSLAVFTIA